MFLSTYYSCLENVAKNKEGDIGVKVYKKIDKKH